MKKNNKIAIAIAAALAGSVLATLPANAASTALSVGGSSVSTGTVVSNPAVLPVPADNSVDSADALRIAITGLDTGTVVSAIANNASLVPALATVAAPVTASAGTASLSISTGTGTTADFYVFTKSTNAGTVVVTVGGNTTTYYVKGSAGPAYNLSVVGADSVAISTVTKVYAKTTDIFGNPVVTTTPSVSAINATVGSVTVSDTATGTFVFDLTAPAVAGTSALSVAITATDVTGFAPAVKTVTKFPAISNPADALASLQAQLAAAKADLATATAALAAEKAAHAATKSAADSAAATAKAASDAAAATAAAAYKAEYNALATKWNKAHPKAKVALKK
jgi:hypothetical protein